MRVVASLITGGGASASILLADEPGNGCTAPQDCWNNFICAGLSFCFGNTAFPDDEARIQCFGDFGDDPSGYVLGYTDCMRNACEDGWGWGGNGTEVKPTLQECMLQYQQFVLSCRLGNDSQYPYGCTTGEYPSVTPAMAKVCVEAAKLQQKLCNKKALGDDAVNPETFDESLFTGGAATDGAFNPDMGQSGANWVKVPDVNNEAPVNGARVHAMVWTETGWEWTVLTESGLDPDGMVSIDLDLFDMSEHYKVHGLELVIEWLFNGETVHGQPVSLSISPMSQAADFDRDGIVTVSDLAAFIDAYNASAPRADFNGDGVVDAADLSAFIAAFDAN